MLSKKIDGFERENYNFLLNGALQGDYIDEDILLYRAQNLYESHCRKEAGMIMEYLCSNGYDMKKMEDEAPGLYSYWRFRGI